MVVTGSAESVQDRGVDAAATAAEHEEAAAGTRKKRKKARPEARTEFRGVSRQRSGRYRAQIKHLGITLYLGTFDTAHEAARGFDAAAVQLRGARAITNFERQQEQPPPATAANDGEAMDFSGFPEVPAELGFLPYGILPLPPDLPPAELRQVDELPNDIGFVAGAKRMSLTKLYSLHFLEI